MTPAQAAILLNALSDTEGWERAGYVLVTRREKVSARALVAKGWLEPAPTYRDPEMGEVYAPCRYKLTAAGQGVAKCLRDIEHGGEPTRTLAEEWARWPGARVCPVCGCTPAYPCLVFSPPCPRLEAPARDAGQGQCVPAGWCDLETCSRCEADRAHGIKPARQLAPQPAW